MNVNKMREKKRNIRMKKKINSGRKQNKKKVFFLFSKYINERISNNYAKKIDEKNDRKEK